MALHCELAPWREPFARTIARQGEWFLEKLQGKDRDFEHILFAEHHPVYTYNPSKKLTRLLKDGVTEDSLSAPLVPIRRGGSITFHGPGQLVCYFVWDLNRLGINVFDFNAFIEMSMLELLLHHQIRGASKPAHLPNGAQGIWVRGRNGELRKIVSRGIVLKKGITQFGCALNISTDLSWFEPIYPCGLPIQMTSLEKETGTKIDLEETAITLLCVFAQNFELLREKMHTKRHLG